MKNTFKKLLPVLIVAFVLVSVLAVTVFATEEKPFPGTVTPLDMSQDGVEASGYADIDGNSAWTQIASPTITATYAFNNANFYWGWNYYAYWNSTTKTIVFMPGTGRIMSGRNNTAGIQVGEGTLKDVTGIDERYWGEKWSGGEKAYYAHSFETWLDANGADVENIEFRPYKGNAGTTPVIAEQFGLYVMDDLVNIKTVKMTRDFSFRAGGSESKNFNQTFVAKPYLTTVQQGTFATTGVYTADTPANAVTLSEGPTTSAKYGVSNVTFRGCTSITRVVIESNTVDYIGLKDYMFKGCTSLQFVKIGVAMSDAYKLGLETFDGCNDVNVYVDDVDAATALAAISNITLKPFSAYDGDIKEYFSKNAPIYAEGALVKIANTGTASGDNVAIRFIFKWDAANTPAAGTPVKVGVVACAASYYESIGGGVEAEKLAALLADANEKKVKKNDIAVYNDGKLSLVGKFLADGTDVENGVYSYAYTLFGIPEANYDSEIYAATYIQWADGTYSVASNGYKDPATGVNKNTISLYDVTLGLFKNGLINSEKVADKYLWNVIDGYSAHSHKMTKASDGGSNVEYFFFPDNLAGGYVLAYKAIEKYNEDGTLKGAVIPHNGNYWGAPAKLASSIPYNNETTTFVVDHGITGVGGARIFGGPYSTTNNTVLKTIVYPTGMSLSGGTHAFHVLGALRDVIWCHTDANGNYVPHMSDIEWNANAKQKDQLFDMRGFGSTVVDSALSSNMSVYTNATIKINIILASNSVANVQNTEKRNVWKES